MVASMCPQVLKYLQQIAVITPYAQVWLGRRVCALDLGWVALVVAFMCGACVGVRAWVWGWSCLYVCVRGWVGGYGTGG